MVQYVDSIIYHNNIKLIIINIGIPKVISCNYKLHRIVIIVLFHVLQ